MNKIIGIILTAFLAASCGSSETAEEGTPQTPQVVDGVVQEQPVDQGQVMQLPPDKNNAQPATPQGVTAHFYCASGDGGTGDAEGPCPNCGATMAHNAGFHNQPGQAQPAQGQPAAPTIELADPGTQPAVQKVPEPAQNAAGQWHYKCPKGHSGGSGGQGTCGECGSALIHNDLYHK